MKKIVSVFLSVLAVISLTACGGKQTGPTYTSLNNENIIVSFDGKGNTLSGSDSIFRLTDNSSGDNTLEGFYANVATADTYKSFASEMDSYQEMSLGDYSGFYYDQPTDAGVEHTAIFYLTEGTTVFFTSFEDETVFKELLPSFSFEITDIDDVVAQSSDVVAESVTESAVESAE